MPLTHKSWHEIDIVGYLLSQQPALATQGREFTDMNGGSGSDQSQYVEELPIHLAVQRDYADIVGMFVQHKNVQTARIPCGSSELSMAQLAALYDSVHVLRGVLLADPLLLTADDEWMETLVELAVRHNGWRFLASLFASRPNNASAVSMSDFDGLSMAHLAAACNSDRALSVVCHAFPMLMDKRCSGRVRVRASADEIECHNQTPLHVASRLGSADAVRVLLHLMSSPTMNSEADRYGQDGNGKTPLELAVAHGPHLDVIELLVAHCSLMVQIKELSGRVDMLSGRTGTVNDVEVLQLSLSTGPVVDDPTLQLLLAARYGRLRRVQSLVATALAIPASTIHKALAYAVIYGHVECAKLLLFSLFTSSTDASSEHRALFEQQLREQFYAVLAARHSQVDTLRLLLPHLSPLPTLFAFSLQHGNFALVDRVWRLASEAMSRDMAATPTAFNVAPLHTALDMFAGDFPTTTREHAAVVHRLFAPFRAGFLPFHFAALHSSSSNVGMPDSMAVQFFMQLVRAAAVVAGTAGDGGVAQPLFSVLPHQVCTFGQFLRFCNASLCDSLQQRLVNPEEFAALSSLQQVQVIACACTCALHKHTPTPFPLWQPLWDCEACDEHGVCFWCAVKCHGPEHRAKLVNARYFVCEGKKKKKE